MIALANYVQDDQPGLDIRLLDLSFTAIEDVQREIASELSTADGRVLVGITTTTATYQAALAVAGALRALAPDAKIILGGHHASPEAAVILSSHHEFIDAVICGEGEVALRDFVRHPDEPQRVPNLAWYDGTVHQNPPAPLLSTQDLDRIHPMFGGGIGIQSAYGKFDHISYVSARGCPLKCSFCAVASEKVRAKSIGKIVEDLRFIVKHLASGSRIAIEDNFFAHNPKRTIDLCRALEELRREDGMDFNWDAQTRVESMVDPAIVSAMSRAGCDAVYLGVESLVPRHLKRMRKTSDPDRYLRVLETHVVPQLLSQGINCYINLQLGFPGETQQDYEETRSRLKAASMLRLWERARGITIFPMLSVIYPGTGDYHDAVQLGGSLYGFRDSAFERFTEWEANHKPVLRWLGQHFAHGTGGICAGILDQDKLHHGHFEVDSRRVFDVATQLTRLHDVSERIKVFNYDRYLVKLAVEWPFSNG